MIEPIRHGEKESNGFVRHPRADERRRSALLLIEVIVPLEIDLGIKRRMLSHALWFVTEAEGISKYRTRFVSVAAIGRPVKELHHEHVVPRKRLIDAMLAKPGRAAEIAGSAVGCTVTREEHLLLEKQDKARPELNGWSRYRAAALVVIDMETGVAGPLDE